ncbi:MAG: hypothetical protein R3C19_14385 [Planctomycetaceae bacterium]
MHSTRGRVLSQADVRVSSAPVRVGEDSPAGHAHVDGVASVSVQRDTNGDVVEIHFRCACGETTVVNCKYEG